jgi:hypothetical protein
VITWGKAVKLVSKYHFNTHQNKRAAESPPHIEAAHTANAFRSDCVHDSGRDVDAPGYCSNLYAGEYLACAHFREGGEVKRNAAMISDENVCFFSVYGRTYLRFPEVPVKTMAMV